MSAHELINEALDIADREKGSLKDVAADRLRIGTRLKLAAVLNPNLFAKRVITKKPTPKKDDLRKVVIEIVKSPREIAEEQESHESNEDMSR